MIFELLLIVSFTSQTLRGRREGIIHCVIEHGQMRETAKKSLHGQCFLQNSEGFGKMNNVALVIVVASFAIGAMSKSGE